MRTINLVLTDSSVDYPDGKCLGRIGEHNAAQVILELPQEMLNGIDYHLISFETGYGCVVSDMITGDSTKPAYLQGGKIHCTLWQELTVSPILLMTAEAYAVLDDKPVMIAKSPLIDGLYFELSVNDSFSAQPNTEAFGLAPALMSLQASEHVHANMELLESYGQPDGAIANAVEKTHVHASGSADLTPQMKANYDAAHNHGQSAHAPSNAQKNVQPDWAQTNGAADDYIKNKPGNATPLSPGLMSAADKARLDSIDSVAGQHYICVNHFSELPQGMPKGTRAYVRNGGAALDFGLYDSLVCETEFDDADFFCLSPTLDLALLTDLPIDQNSNTSCIELTDIFKDSATGEPVPMLTVTTGGVTCCCFSHSFLFAGIPCAKGWNHYDNGTYTPCAPPAVHNFNLKCLNAGGHYYASGDAMPENIAVMLKDISRLVNVSKDEMREAGSYFYDGASWVFERDENRLVRFTGRLKPNRKYFASLNANTTFTLPSAQELDPETDNAILVYLSLSKNTVISFTGDVIYYGREAPITAAGFHELILTYNALAKKWQVGGLLTGALAV
ncbi:MAG: hypothetical protein FWF05_06740 [Oscillospiraceae bacterium]|nr:hypothetical protein [Oscillospiraceae bacterium]